MHHESSRPVAESVRIPLKISSLADLPSLFCIHIKSFSVDGFPIDLFAVNNHGSVTHIFSSVSQHDTAVALGQAPTTAGKRR